MKIFGKQILFNSNLFEMLVTLGSCAIASVLALFNIPQDIPVAIPQYVAMIGILGFVAGFVTSNFLVWCYKELAKSMKKPQ